MARILIVDDEEMDRVFESSVLSDAGHEILFAHDGEGALRVFRSTRIDLVITDLAMPELNGLRLIQELRGYDANMPIVAISGISADQLDLAKEYGATHTFIKPVDPGELFATVRDLLKEMNQWKDHWW